MPPREVRARAPRTRRWVFTLNNPAEHLPGSEGGVFDPGDATYWVYQLERGEAGTEHLQGLLVFGSVKSMDQVLAIVPGGHVERMRGRFDQAKAYCTKEDTRVAGPWEGGQPPRGPGSPQRPRAA